MKFSLAVIATFAAAVSATPIRIITLTGVPTDNLHAFDNLPAPDAQPELSVVTPPFRPCEKHRASSPTGPLGALLSRLGFTPSPSHQSDAADIRPYFDTWKHHVEDAMNDAEGRIVPLMEGGVVRILPIMNEAGQPDREDASKHQDHANWKSLEGKEGVRHHRHRVGQRQATSFSGRLHRALHNLKSAESIAFAFVLGAGIGSILHLIFMLFLISFRSFRCGKQNRAERRAARKARRAARREGGVKLRGEEGEAVENETLPSYEEGEGARLVEKA